MNEHPLEQQRRTDETSGQYRVREESWRGEERRTGGWTLWKEIIGTAIALLPFALGFLAWASSIDKQTALNTSEIAHLRESRGETLAILSKISDQISALQQAVAKIK